jgi:hypothetical protein
MFKCWQYLRTRFICSVDKVTDYTRQGFGIPGWGRYFALHAGSVARAASESGRSVKLRLSGIEAI